MNSDIFRRAIWLHVAMLVIVSLPSTVIAQASGEEPGSSNPANELSAAFRAAVERVRPSIVFIEAHSGPRELIEWNKHVSPLDADEPGGAPTSDDDADERLRDAYRDALGTGIVFDPRGCILTCNHVVESADVVFVRLADKRRFEAVQVFGDAQTDLAVIQIADAGPLTAAPLGDSDKLRAGDWVVSLGNPYSLGLSVSAGIVSGTERQSPLAPRTPLIQTDAASNPGNSGGALIDLDGRVVGISEGGYGSTEGLQGIGLAIPINLAKRVAQQLIVDGKIPRVTLGFDTEVISSEVAEHLGIANKFGLIVTDVKSQMPAAEGGLRVGDVVVAFNDKQIRNSLDLLKLMERVVPGSEIALSVIRERQPIEIKVRSKELSDKPKAKASADTKPAAQPSGYQDAALGLTLEKMSPELADKLGYASAAEGLVISYVRPKSPAAKEELFAGMVILRIDGKPVRSLDEYQRMTGDRTSEDGILMLIGTPRRKHFVVLRQ